MNAESFDPPSLEDLESLLTGYQLIAFIAQGGMGAVYKARQRSLDRDVAIKILPREFGADPEFRASFETEAKAMARLNHPNLIGVFDYGDADGMPYIVMEYVPGKSLFHSAHNLAVEPRQAVTIVKAICDGLAHAHENGVIHRDIKPANILLTPKAEPKVGDFGLARPAGENSTGLLMGTPGYSAPEIIRQPDHADHRSDIFALGVVLYELLIGKCPPYDVPPPPPSTLVGCSKELDVICAIAMHPAASMRYPSAESMSAALDQWLRGDHRVPPPRTTGSIPQGAAHAPVRAPKSMEPAPAMVKSRSGVGSLVIQAGVLAVLIVVTAIAWKYLKGMEAEKASKQAAYDAAKTHQTASSGSSSTKPPRPSGETSKPIPDTGTAGTDTTTPVKPDPDPGTPANPTDAGTTPEADIASTDNHTTDPTTPVLGLGNDIKPEDIIKPPVELPPAIVELETKARALLQGQEKDRDRELTENAKSFSRDLDTWLRTLSKGDQVTWKPHVERLKRLATATRVPPRVDTDSGINLSERMAKIAEFGARKQKAIDDGFESKVGKIRDAYVTRVKEAAAKARESGDEKVATALDERASGSAELAAWMRIIHPEENLAFVLDQTGVAPAGAALKIVSAVYGTGGKNADVTEKVREWLTVKKEAFRVTPPDLGADPNPGWNKGLTITYVLDGAEAKKSWGENSQVSPSDFVPESSAKAVLPENANDPMLGRWVLNREVTFIVEPNGTATNHKNGWVGKWKYLRSGPGGRVYEMAWQDGRWRDTITLSSDKNELKGANQEGDRFEAEREPVGTEPLTGAWSWNDGGGLFVFRPDGTSFTEKDNGKWKIVAKTVGKRIYTVTWESGSIDELVIEDDPNQFSGTNSKGAKIGAKRAGR
ncbi:serine/threonine-protein kinase [Luteolibacter soli]|uniref:Serine/threonine-protein kinase n=1 Tax=Luteolibacter soli TaxID=3135280 RepID=A0ABU9B2R4_9BACT